MRFISRKLHAVLDYFSAAFLVAAPWLLNFKQSDYASSIAIGAGVLVFLMSLFTNYEGGLVRKLSMWTHLALDITLGLLLAISPWMFGFYETAYLPHLIIGLIAIGAGFTTKGGRIQQNAD
ncbi:MAG: hypothetical protein EOO91_00975 [Pedobacter sp.]|nr:MAG: hypothetical protein EOO91_00975 [Pedobacter sp.]